MPVTQATHTRTIPLTFLTWVSAMTGPKLKNFMLLKPSVCMCECVRETITAKTLILLMLGNHRQNLLGLVNGGKKSEVIPKLRV